MSFFIRIGFAKQKKIHIGKTHNVYWVQKLLVQPVGKLQIGCATRKAL